jgi:hypothetical protein
MPSIALSMRFYDCHVDVSSRRAVRLNGVVQNFIEYLVYRRTVRGVISFISNPFQSREDLITIARVDRQGRTVG